MKYFTFKFIVLWVRGKCGTLFNAFRRAATQIMIYYYLLYAKRQKLKNGITSHTKLKMSTSKYILIKTSFIYGTFNIGCYLKINKSSGFNLKIKGDKKYQ